MCSISRVTSRTSMCSSSITSGMVPSFSRPRPRPRGASGCLGLQVSIHEVYLLQPAKALADVLRPYLPHALDRFQLGVGRGNHLLQPSEFADDLLHDQSRQARYASEDAIAAR